MYIYINYMDTARINVFTDGSCLKNGCKNSKGGIGVFFDINSEYNLSEKLDCAKITNQVAELTAISRALDQLINMKNKKMVYLYTDSLYSINIFTDWFKKWEQNNWKKVDGKAILNLDLIKDINDKLKKQIIIFKHVRSHKAEPSKNDPNYNIWFGNNQADLLATSSSNN